MKSASTIKSIFLSAIGMFIGYLLAAHIDRIIPKVFAYNNFSDMVSTRGLEIVDKEGRRQILLATSEEGSPGIWFFDKNGRSRLNLGLYEDGNATIVLNDENQQAVQIFRTVGSQNAPVLVMKSQGRDRIILGLNGSSQDPFFVTYDQAGAKKLIFGSY